MGSWGTFIVKEKMSIWHSADAKRYVEGEKVKLDHLEAAGVKQLLELGIVDAGPDVDLDALYAGAKPAPAKTYSRFEAFLLNRAKQAPEPEPEAVSEEEE